MKSYWINSVKKEEFESLYNDKKVDVCIIGGGLTGLTTAYYLSKTNLNVVLLEKTKLCEHTSGYTTAKITSQHGLFYHYLIQSQGREKAEQYLEANEQAIQNIQNIIKEENIECDFEKQNAYVFTKDQKEVAKIKREVEDVKSLGKEAKFVTETKLPFPILGAIEFTGQAQFNPCKYAQGLVKAIQNSSKENQEEIDSVNMNKESSGTKNISKEGEKQKETSKMNSDQKTRQIEIFENTKVMDLKKQEEEYEILTENGNKVIAKYVVIASHYPIINAPGFYFLKMYQSLSYVVVAETSMDSLEGIYINSEKPTISIRMVENNGKKLLMVGGFDHKTGEKKDLSQSYVDLEKVAKQIDPQCNIIYRWCTEDCITLDKIPYIGEFSSMMANVYLGTGYNKWGMTSSNIAANIIVDKILGKENPYEEVFTSTRMEPIKNRQEVGNIVKEVAQSLIVSQFKIPQEKLSNISIGEGGIVEIEGQKIGIYRDENNKTFAIKPTCSHLGCELTWNNLEKTWDCPCHGSRFTYTGKSIYDPSIRDLQRIEIIE